MVDRPILAPPVEVRQLTLGQENELSRHFTKELDRPESERLLNAIKEWFLFDMPNRSDKEFVENQQHFERERWAKIAKLARDLHCQLADSSPPLVDWNGIPFAEYDAFSSTLIGGGHHVEWLARLAETAKTYSTAPKRRRGPRGLEWRDELVALVIAHYPADKIAYREGSHFEKTIGMLLRYVGAGLKDAEALHSTINRIRERGVEPPFIIDP